MSLEYLLGAGVSVLLLGYLVYALLYPSGSEERGR
jgi:K+-transporting ATPase KdpF subunit